MKDFSKGIYSEGDGQYIPKGAVREAINVEYNDSPLLEIRKVTEEFSSEFSDVEYFCIWYPSHTPSDSDNKYVVVYYKDTTLYLAKQVGGTWESNSVEITGIEYKDSSVLRFFAGNKLLIADVSNTFTATLSPVLKSYITGAMFIVSVPSNNTGACTLELNGLGAKDIKIMSGGSLDDPASGDLDSDGIYILIYDGTQFQLINPS